MGWLDSLRRWWRRLKPGDASGDAGGPYHPGVDDDRTRKAEAQIEAAAAEQFGAAGAFDGGGGDGGGGGGGD